MNPRFYLSVAAFAALAAAPLSAQAPRGDVELLGERHGTRPPAAYYETLGRDPGAFGFSRAWKARNPRLRRVDGAGPDGRPRFEAAGPAGVDRSLQGPAALGPRDEPVTGTIRVPLVLGLFQDSPAVPPFTQEAVQREFFDGPNTRGATITDYYGEVSGGLVELLGETQPWKRASLTEEEVTGGVSALGNPGRIGLYVVQVVSQNPGVDWGRYDNDGPDGIPNSGDDDGYVDVLAIMHPNFGAECGGSGRDDRIWSHKWNLDAAVGDPYTTDVPMAGGGGNIKIDDYTVQPVYACPDGGQPSEINEIGVLAHELGHGFGLPDLYDTRSSGSHNGIGGWGLMGSGSWGCSQGGPELPCHMSAWSKEQLGWVEVVTLEPGMDLGRLAFEPVETDRRVYRMDAPGTDEYFLVENRQALGFDADVPRPGLLVWHVDGVAVANRWSSNTVNASDRMGVFLVQADGQNNLGQRGGGNRGDAGDPFPGSSGNTRFHASSQPGSLTWGGDASGLTLTGLALDGLEVGADVLTRFQQVTLAAAGEGEIDVAFAVDGASVGSSTSFQAAPYQVVEIEAGRGPELSDGVRVGFAGWDDDPSLGRLRTFQTPADDVALTARYGGEEVRTRLTVEGQEYGVPPGTVQMFPAPRQESDGLWFPRSTSVTFEALPNTGYGFGGWTGRLEGMANPAVLSIDDPVDIGVVFELTYVVEDATHAFEAAQEQEIVLVAENGLEPVTWTPVGGTGLPRGMSLDGGTIRGAALETGTFSLTLRARDANGLQATGEIALEVAEPVLGVNALAAQFVGTAGSLTAAERAFLDARGNDDGFYDLGDFRAWILAHPDLPETVEERALVRAVVPLIRFQPGGGR